MDAKDLEPAQFRAAVFTPNLGQFQAAHVLGRLLGALPQFSGDPAVLPVPSDAPPEIPRIILKAPAEGLELQVGLARSDLFANAKPGHQLVPQREFEAAARILEEVLSALNIRPGRLAATGSYFLRCEDPSTVLANHFCKPQWAEGPLSGLRAFELNALRRLPLLEGLIVNSWVKCQTGQVNEPGPPSAAIVVERDVNTLPEEAEEKQFTPEEVAGFMTQAGRFLGDELEGFLPAQGV
jgi:hypothetical protein